VAKQSTPPPDDGGGAQMEELLQQHEAEAAAVVEESAYLGGDLEEEQLEEEALEQQIARELDQESSSSERRIKLLEEQLAETNALVKKLSERNESTAGIVIATLDEQRTAQNRIKYDRIREAGGFAVIQLHNDESASRNWPVPITVNGHKVEVPRGVPVRVNVAYVEALDNSSYTSHEKVLDGNDNPRIEPRFHQFYPYHMIDETGNQQVRPEHDFKVDPAAREMLRRVA